MHDFHFHSNYSDGLHSPNELYEMAIKRGLRVVSLTDHDEIAGIYELEKVNTENKLKIIPGIEISTRWKKHDIHVIGLNINTESQELKDFISKQQETREKRAEAIAENLAFIGVKDLLAKARASSGGDIVARPHFAKVLVKEGKARDIQHAFSLYLQRGRRGYVETNWANLSETIDIINKANGVAVLAHPLKYKLTNTKLIELIANFKELGGLGIELVSGNVTNDEVQRLNKIATKYDLYASTGSDFHGENLSQISLGGQAALPVNCRPIWELWL